VGREWFSEKAGLIAAFLYAISPVVIIYSRSSWNPNVIPFFALLTIYGVWQFWQKEKFIWLPIIGVALSFAIQSHYLGILLIPVVGLFWGLRGLRLLREKNEKLKYYILYTIYSILIFFVLTVAPLIWFDLRHNFINSQAFFKFFSDRQTTVNLKVYKAIPNLWPLWELAITRLLSAKEIIWGKLIAVLFFLALVIQGRVFLKRPVLWLLFAWILIGLSGMGLYKQHIYDHYFGFIFPAPFLLVGFLLDRLGRRGRLGMLGILGFLALASYFNFRDSPLKYAPNYQMKKVQEVDQKIVQESASESFNFALIAKQNYEAGYEYFLEAWKTPLVRIDPQKAKETITDQLFVVCEDPVCEPINHPKAEIANFGWSMIDKTWEFPWGVKLFKLIHLNKN
jgi:4-amino-4-deoxy-L-arabinose transferase-like glycosyltransferase